jgi:dipeptidyl aminopeptidase/acylaminoacyl peptidase
MTFDGRAMAPREAVDALYSAMWRPGTTYPHAADQLEQVRDEVWFIGQSTPGALETGPRTAAYALSASGAARTVREGARLLSISGRIGLAAVGLSVEEGRDVVEWRPTDNPETVLDTWAAPGRVEQMRWSPDGTRLVLLVAGPGADLAGREGGYALRALQAGPDWLPEVTTPSSSDRWRSLWVWEGAGEPPRRLTRPPCNPWEVSWWGNACCVVIASDDPDEGSWFRASLRRISMLDGLERELHRPNDQLGFAAGSPDGRAVAWVEAVCSDRGLICGDVMLQAGNAAPKRLDTRGVQATDLAWRDDRCLVFAGLRGLETVVGEIDTVSGRFLQRWASRDRTLSGWQPSARPAEGGRVLLTVEGYCTAPAIEAVASDGGVHGILNLGPASMPGIGVMRPIQWSAPDGGDIEGLLIEPAGTRPANGWLLYVDIHGGPIWAHRCRWAAHLRADAVLVQQGWAVLLPNPRGSAGRTQDFARAVVGDMGGADLDDVVAGIDHLVAHGIADERRVAAGGSSYGGYLTSWLVARTRRLMAAIPISPVTDWYHQHYASQAPWFDKAFLRASPVEPGGAYHARSPAFHAGSATTTTLVMAGARDKNAPPAQALEFHNALVEAGATSELVVYPKGGHSLRSFPEYLDSAVRMVDFLHRALERSQRS